MNYFNWEWFKLEERIPAEANLILIGKPEDFPLLSEEGYFPALKFNPDGLLDAGSGLTVVAQAQPASASTWLAIRSSGGANDRMLLAVLGNGGSLLSAVKGITSAKIKNDNIAQIFEKGPMNGSFESIIARGSAAQTSETPATTPSSSNLPQQFRWNMIKWVVPLIALLLVIVVVFLLGEFRARRQR
jgi:hypothetical protein